MTESAFAVFLVDDDAGVLNKLGVRSVADLVRLAEKAGITRSES